MESRPNSQTSPEIPKNPEVRKGLKRLFKDRIDDRSFLNKVRAQSTAMSLVLACAGGVNLGFKYFSGAIPKEFGEQYYDTLATAYSTASNYNIGLNAIELMAVVGSIAAVMGWDQLRGRGGRAHLNKKEYYAEPVVYQGKKPLDILDIKKGDNLLYCDLPKPAAGTILTPEASALYRQASIDSLKSIRNQTADYEYKAMIIEPQPFLPQLEHAEKTPKHQILAGKDIRPAASDSVLLSPDDLEKLISNPQSELQAALEKLEDPILNEQIQLAKQASTPEQIEFMTTEINRYLKGKLHLHALSHFATPERRKPRQLSNSDKAKRFISSRQSDRIEKTVTLLTDAESKLILKVTNGSEGFTIRDLHTALGIEEKADLETLDPISPHFKAQLYYSVYELFRNNSFGDLTEERETDPEKIAQQLSDMGFPIAETKDARETLTDTKKRLDLIKQIERALLPLVVAAVIYTAGSSLEKVTNNLDFSSITQVTDLFPKVSGTSPLGSKSENNLAANTKHKPNATGAPPHTLDWSISTERGSGLEKGYFATETSNKMEHGEWVINRDRKGEIQVPKPPPRKNALQYDLQDYVALSRWVELPYSPSFSFKLPVREGTKLSYLEIDLDPDKYKVYELTDGTIEVEITQDLFDFEGATKIEAVFTKSETPTVKAVSPIAKIDESKLDPKNAQRIQVNTELFSDETFLESIALKAKLNHTYSVRTANSDKLKQATTPEEIVNIVSADQLCNCDTCSSQANLESTLGQTEGHFSNQAFGYLSGVNQFNQGHQTFLTGDTLHGYMVTNNGRVIDPTPSEISPEDEETKQYINSISRDDDIDRFYNNNKRLIDKRYSGSNPGDIARILRSVLGVGLLAGAGLGARRLLNNERREQTTAITNTAKRKLFLSSISKNDLKSAYRFFPWLSFGEDGEFSQENLDGLNKDDLLTKINDNSKNSTILEYRRNPKTAEEQTGISGLQALKMRYIAHFIQGLKRP